MRIVLDLRCVQPADGQAHDACGDALELACAMARVAGPEIDLRVVLDGALETSIEPILAQLAPDLPRQAVSLCALPRSEGSDPSRDGPVAAFACDLVRLHLSTIEPDAVLQFDGTVWDGVSRGATRIPRLPDVLSVVVLGGPTPHDERGTRLADGDPPLTRSNRLEAVDGADLLLAMSDVTHPNVRARLTSPQGTIVNIGAGRDAILLPRARRPRHGSLPPDPYLLVATGDRSADGLTLLVEAVLRLPLDVAQDLSLLHIGALDEGASRAAEDRLEQRGVVRVFDPCDLDLLANAIDHAALTLLSEGREDLKPSALEVMARGAPVVAWPGSDPLGIAVAAATPDDGGDPAIMARAIEELLHSPARRAELGARLRRHARSIGWEGAAEAALDAIVLAVRGRSSGLRGASRYRIDDAVAACARPVAAGVVSADMAVDCLIASGRLGAEAGPPRLLVDVTQTSSKDAGTGIQRVVRRTVDSLRSVLGVDKGGRLALPVVLGLDGARTAPGFGAMTDAAVTLRAGETLLMLDSSWDRYPDFTKTFEAVRRHGGRVVTVVYDLAPLLHPDVVADGMSASFDLWFRHALVESDGLACISESVAREVIAFVQARSLPHRDGLRIGWWHLGSDLPPSRRRREVVLPALDRFLEQREPLLLMVGTLEPRKRHEVALRAMEQLWAGGSPARLLILGREGWRTADLAARLRGHPELGRRLLWIEGSDDDALSKAYARASALLFPSLYEGYGLPVVEAARAGLGAICSDIPVLREVGGVGAIYAPVNDPDAWAHAIGDVIAGYRRVDPLGTKALTWDESARHLAEILYADRWHAVLRSGNRAGPMPRTGAFVQGGAPAIAP